MKPSVYIETSVVSYLVSQDSRDILVLAHQQVTRTWWQTRLPEFRGFVSPVVLEEARAGDREQAQKRSEVLNRFEVLQARDDVESLAARLMADLRLPPNALRDAAHLAFACVYELDYLVTWNCAHIANAQIVRRLTRLNAIAGIWTPTICTPEELLETSEA
jgi:predicted nucleic acid-binding protein